MNRIVADSFWTDDKVINYFSPEDKYFLLYLLTNPHVTPIGIYPINFRLAGFEMGYSTEAVAALFDRFEHKYQMVHYSKETGEVMIKNYLLFAIIKGGAPVHDVLVKYLNEVKDKRLVVMLYQHLYAKLNDQKKINETVKEFIENELSASAAAHLEESKNEPELKLSNFELEQNSDKCLDKCPTDVPKKKKKTPKPIEAWEVFPFLEYDNIQITSTKYQRLIEKHGQKETDDMIVQLSLWKKSKGKKTGDDGATVDSWFRRREKEKPKPPEIMDGVNRMANEIDQILNAKGIIIK